MKITREDIEIWRNELETIASDTSVPKRFRMSPSGRCAVIYGENVVYDGNDIDAALAAYN